MSTASDSRVSKAGLEDVVATSSGICFIDGDRGVLAYRGYDIHDLATHATFEEVCYLLWHGRLPTRAELGELQSQFAVARPAAGRDRAPASLAAALRRDGSAADAGLCARALRCGRDGQLRCRELPQGRQAHRSTGQPGGDAGPVRGRRRADPAGRRHGVRGELPVHAHRCAPRRAVDARVGRRPRAPCRSRAERVDVRGARRRGDADRRALCGGRRDRDAEGTAARRGERRGHEDAAGPRCRCDARQD